MVCCWFLVSSKSIQKYCMRIPLQAFQLHLYDVQVDTEFVITKKWMIMESFLSCSVDSHIFKTVRSNLRETIDVGRT